MTDLFTTEEFTTMLRKVDAIYRAKGMDSSDKSNLIPSLSEYNVAFDEYLNAIWGVTDEAYRMIPNADTSKLLDKVVQLTFCDGFSGLILGKKQGEYVSYVALNEVVKLTSKEKVQNAFNKYHAECVEEINAKRFL